MKTSSGVFLLSTGLLAAAVALAFFAVLSYGDAHTLMRTGLMLYFLASLVSRFDK